MKCIDCRNKDVELLTFWERFRNNLFYYLFPQDIIDLSQNKYTQGFGDGLEKGRLMERTSMRDVLKKIYNIDI